MAVENANFVHACASIFLANPPSFARNNGFTLLSRVSAGVFRLAAIEPIDFLGGGLVVTPAADTPRMVSARIRSLADEGPDNFLISCFDAAGNPADIGEVYAVLYRYPTSGEPPP